MSSCRLVTRSSCRNRVLVGSRDTKTVVPLCTVYMMPSSRGAACNGYVSTHRTRCTRKLEPLPIVDPTRCSLRRAAVSAVQVMLLSGGFNAFDEELVKWPTPSDTSRPISVPMICGVGTDSKSTVLTWQTKEQGEVVKNSLLKVAGAGQVVRMTGLKNAFGKPSRPNSMSYFEEAFAPTSAFKVSVMGVDGAENGQHYAELREGKYPAGSPNSYYVGRLNEAAYKRAGSIKELPNLYGNAVVRLLLDVSLPHVGSPHVVAGGSPLIHFDACWRCQPQVLLLSGPVPFSFGGGGGEHVNYYGLLDGRSNLPVVVRVIAGGTAPDGTLQRSAPMCRLLELGTYVAVFYAGLKTSSEQTTVHCVRRRC